MMGKKIIIKYYIFFRYKRGVAGTSVLPVEMTYDADGSGPVTAAETFVSSNFYVIT